MARIHLSFSSFLIRALATILPGYSYRFSVSRLAVALVGATIVFPSLGHSDETDARCDKIANAWVELVLARTQGADTYTVKSRYGEYVHSVLVDDAPFCLNSDPIVNLFNTTLKWKRNEITSDELLQLIADPALPTEALWNLEDVIGMNSESDAAWTKLFGSAPAFTILRLAIDLLGANADAELALVRMLDTADGYFAQDIHDEAAKVLLDQPGKLLACTNLLSTWRFIEFLFYLPAYLDAEDVGRVIESVERAGLAATDERSAANAARFLSVLKSGAVAAASLESE